MLRLVISLYVDYYHKIEEPFLQKSFFFKHQLQLNPYLKRLAV